jgi:hypothetical protein
MHEPKNNSIQLQLRKFCHTADSRQDFTTRTSNRYVNKWLNSANVYYLYGGNYEDYGSWICTYQTKKDDISGVKSPFAQQAQNCHMVMSNVVSESIHQTLKRASKGVT